MNKTDRKHSMDRLLSLHCCVHGMPKSQIGAGQISIQGQQIETIEIQGPLDSLPLSFEQVEARLAEISGLHIEPDGWFIWGEGVAEQRWQIDGQLFDRGDQVGYVELRGSCPSQQFDVLLQAFGASQCKLIMQLVQQGIYTDIDSLKRVALVK